MSPREIAARAKDAAYTFMQRSGHLVVTDPPSPVIRSSASWIAGCVEFESKNYVAAAERILEGKSPVFALQDGSNIFPPQWNRDPLTNIVAPHIFGKSIDLRSQSIVGNIKYLWEPNRHLELVSLAQAYDITGDTRYLRGIESALLSWLDQCPYLTGPNWASALELSIRLINWSIVWQLIGGAESSLFESDEGSKLRDRWLASIFQHVHFVRNHYARYSSANNHLIGEAAGVFVASCTWPFWDEFNKWSEDARGILISAADSQTHGDGVNREQAVAYQQFVLDFFIVAALAGRAVDHEFPLEFWRTVERMIEFIQAIMDTGGNVPMIGDADDGVVVRLSQESGFCPYRSLLATGAILFNRPDFATKSRELDDKTRFLLGDERWRELSSKTAKLTTGVQRQFPDGGYYIIGQAFDTESEIHMLVDAGSLGYLSIAAHGHADALAVCLSVAGREFLVDPGTYTYHGKPEWRKYFRSSLAHNTVTVDEQDQSEQGGGFMWVQHAQAKCIDFMAGTNNDTFIGEHDGYARLSDPVIHERKISRDGTSIDITDTLKCSAFHSAKRCWHFSEQCTVTVSGSQVRVENEGIKIFMTANDPETEIVCVDGSDQTNGGWVSRRFDVKSASTTVYFLDKISGTTALSTSIQCLVD